MAATPLGQEYPTEKQNSPGRGLGCRMTAANRIPSNLGHSPGTDLAREKKHSIFFKPLNY